MHPKELFGSPLFYKLLMSQPYAYEKKYDGVRCISWMRKGNLKIIAYDKKLEMYSRNGRHLENLVDKFINKLDIPEGFVFDGELFLQDFSTTMSIVMSDHPVRQPDYYVFDMVPIDTVLKGKTYNVPYNLRKENLFKALLKCKDNVHYIEYKKSTFTKESEITNLIDSLVSQKFEGCVFKLINSPYIPKRSIDWIKGKKIFTLDLLVLGVINSKEHIGKIQSVVCKLGKLQQPVGSGLTEEQRSEWFKDPKKIIGKIVEVKFAEYTKEGYLRQPSFVRIRIDKNYPDK